MAQQRYLSYRAILGDSIAKVVRACFRGVSHNYRTTGGYRTLSWEVLNGVGVDGVGGIFRFFGVVIFLCFSSLFFVFFLFLLFYPILLGQEQTTAIYWVNREFHSNPVCTNPVQKFPNLGRAANLP